MRIALLIDRETYLNIQQSMVKQILDEKYRRNERRPSVRPITIDQIFGNYEQSPISTVPNREGYNFFRTENGLESSFYTVDGETTYGIMRIADKHYAFFRGDSQYLSSQDHKEFEQSLCKALVDILPKIDYKLHSKVNV